MKGNYTIKNFRCFDSNGVDVQFEPITILTGGNSSGKSSIVKSLLLLTDYLSSAMEMRRHSYDYTDFESILTRTRLDFSKYPNNLLGNFDKVINRDRESDTISYIYSQYSKALKDDVYVELSFSLLKSDDMKDGWLSTLKISDSNNNIFCRAHNEAGQFVYDYVNLCTLKPLFMIHNALNLIAFSERYKDTSDSRIKDEQLKFLKNYLKERGFDTDNIQPFADGVDGFAYPYYRDSMSISFIKDDIIYYHHLLDKLESKSKEETISILSSKAAKTKKEDIIDITKMICSDYEKSDYAAFIDYYRAKENEAFVISGRKETQKRNRFRESAFHTYASIPVNIPGGKRGFPSDISLNNQDISSISIGDIFGCLIAISSHNDEDNSPMMRRMGIRGISELFFDFAYNIIRSSVFADFAKDFNYASSTRADVRRLYALENKDDFSLLLRRYFDAKRKFYSNGLKKSGYTPGNFLNKWINNFGIGKAIRFDANRDGLGVALSVMKESGTKNILAEEGYGITQLFSILLQIEVSVIETIIANYSESINPYVTIAIEEPEIHLHPMYQSMLADVFLDAYESFAIHFIIETHSEYLIRRSQVIVSKRSYKSTEELATNNPFKVYYFPTKAAPYDMKYRIDGKFSNDFGTGFFDEASNLAFELF